MDTNKSKVSNASHFSDCIIFITSLLYTSVLGGLYKLLCNVIERCKCLAPYCKNSNIQVFDHCFIFRIEQQTCDVPLRMYFWLSTMQLILDLFRADIMHYVLRWDSRSQRNVPFRVIVYNLCYVSNLFTFVVADTFILWISIFNSTFDFL